MDGDRLDERFHRLRTVLQHWEIQLAQMPEVLLKLFDDGDLAGIYSLQQQRKFLAERIHLLNLFLHKWEKPHSEFISGVTRLEDEKEREIFP